MYASFELAPQVPTSSLLGRSRRRLRRTLNGSHESGDDGEFERERMRNVRRRIDLLVDESSVTHGGYSQWREALLYNIGAVTLPEGNGDTMCEFDNAWKNATRMR